MSINKKPYSYVGISLIILVFGIWAVPKIVDRLLERTDLLVVGEVPAFELIDQNNKVITQDTYKGKVYLVEFFFSSCPGICLAMNKNMQLIQKKFLGDSRFGIASISIDPERDTPEKLKSYSQRYQAGPNWHFLTGNKDKIYELANKGFNLYAGYNPDSEDGFEHSGMFALVDKEGNIRCRKDKNGNPIIYYKGTELGDVNLIKEDISKLLN